MKITLKHDQNSVDPSATCTDAQFETTIEALEQEYTTEIKKTFPHAQIDFSRGDFCGKSIEISGVDLPALYDVEDEVQAICEGVYEKGNFWS